MHMKMAGAEIVAGIRNSNINCRGLQTLSDITKRLGIINWAARDEGWGIRAIQGWSLMKVSLWLGGATFTGGIFALLWLIKVSKTDLQNAFVPMIYLLTTIMVVMGIPAFLVNT
jgi:hypothetical protein